MPRTGLQGPYPLTRFGVEKEVEPGVPGVYVLGSTRDDTFFISYVGRSDSDVEDRLKDWIGKYKQYKFGYSFEPKDAYEKECHLYHDFGGYPMLDNKIHPQRPEGTKYKCPVQDCPEN